MFTNPFGFPVSVPGSRAEVRLWSPLIDVDHEAQNQIRSVAGLPWTHAVAVMPDVHAGTGVTVGSVVAMNQAVSPAAVGCDIGCGMMAVQTSITINDLPDDLKNLRMMWESVVPVGFAKHKTRAEMLKTNGMLRQQLKKLFGQFSQLRVDVSHAQNTAERQCGTLGGGNHFIELCSDDQDQLWLMLHSGSRVIGKEIAERHIAKAKRLEWNSDIKDRNLAVFLHRDETGRVYPEWTDYLHDLYWAQHYAAFNRLVMMESIKSVFAQLFPAVEFSQQINCHHNYVSEETYEGRDLVITRKGAISAQAGQLGVIPGSMGTGSYIVRGLGNVQSFCSASHGAGRTMSRGAARALFSLDDLVAQTKGVECRKDYGVVDETPAAYKDLQQVMAYQQDLVTIEQRLETLLCIKG